MVPRLDPDEQLLLRTLTHRQRIRDLFHPLDRDLWARLTAAATRLRERGMLEQRGGWWERTRLGEHAARRVDV